MKVFTKQGNKIMFSKRGITDVTFCFVEGEFDKVEGNAALKKEAEDLCRNVNLSSYAMEELLGSCKKSKPPPVRPRGRNTCGHCFETQVEDFENPWYQCEECSRYCHASCANKALGRIHSAEDAYFCPECVEAIAAKRIP
jgi:hypothetical protein